MNTLIVHAYLNKLRDSGEINMMGAAPLLKQTFGMSRSEAREAVLEWMKTTSFARAAAPSTTPERIEL